MAMQVVLYMSNWCSASQDTQRALKEWGVPAAFVNVREDRAAADRLKGWVGFESVPTVVIAETGSLEPFEAPASLPAGSSPRGIDRGSIITEATRVQLRAWLVKHGQLAA